MFARFPRLISAAGAGGRKSRAIRRYGSASNAASYKLERARVSSAAQHITCTWSDGHASVFNFTWLRANCPSNRHSSRQLTFFPKDPGEPKTVQGGTGEEGEETIQIAWPDGHTSTFKSEWLREHDSTLSTSIQRTFGNWGTALRSWDVIPRVERASLRDKKGLYHLLHNINVHGLAIVDNCGVKEGSVAELATLISPLSHSYLYGSVYDVVSMEDSRNIAYTSEQLALHMDLVYYESPPGLQLLHCLAFDEGIKGGGSQFMDMFEAAATFRKLHPDHFSTLTSVPATFMKIRDAAPAAVVGDTAVAGDGEGGAEGGVDDPTNAAAWMVYHRPHIVTTPEDNEIVGVYWAPMFEGTLMARPASVQKYYDARAAFVELISDSDFSREYTIEHRLEPGQTVVINNRRMCHGRSAFSSEVEGEGHRRHLQGCYLNIDESLSRFATLHRRYRKSKNDCIRRVGNESMPPF